ncbi:MAG: phBC6A51 family helix-turn-helix protein [Bacillota bacterium]
MAKQGKTGKEKKSKRSNKNPQKTPRKLLPRKAHKYLELLLNPEKLDLTKEEIAAEVGVNRKTLWDWEQKPEFWAEYDKILSVDRKRFKGQLLKRSDAIALHGDPSSMATLKAMEISIKTLNPRGELVDKQDTKAKVAVDIHGTLGIEGEITNESLNNVFREEIKGIRELLRELTPNREDPSPPRAKRATQGNKKNQG